MPSEQREAKREAMREAIRSRHLVVLGVVLGAIPGGGDGKGMLLGCLRTYMIPHVSHSNTALLSQWSHSSSTHIASVNFLASSFCLAAITAALVNSPPRRSILSGGTLTFILCSV